MTSPPDQRREGETKRAIRSLLRARRRDLGSIQVAASGGRALASLREIGAWSAAGAVVVYDACENEIPTGPAIEAARSAGQFVFLPAVEQFCFRLWDRGQPLASGLGGSYGATGECLTSDRHAIFLVPLVGWNKRGVRLGRGGGFYDRAIAPMRWNGSLVIGLGYDCQEYDDLPEDPWDIPMDYVITESRVVRSRR